MRCAALICGMVGSWMLIAAGTGVEARGQEDSEAKGPLQPGDIALVVEDRAPLMQKDEVLLRLRIGSEFTVQELRDEWIGGLVQLADEPRTGWVRPDALVPLDEALSRFGELLKRSPRDYDLLLVNARLLRDAKRWEEARGLYDRAVAVGPNDKRGFQQRGYLSFLQEDYKQAVEDYSRAIKLDPRDALSFTNRGLNHQALGLAAKALEDYDQAIELSERNALAMNNAAWLRATSPDDAVRDGELAVKLAKAACALTDFANFDFLDTLAAAHAEAGQFEQAVELAGRAVEQAPAEHRDEIQSRKSLYENRKSFRDNTLAE